MRKLAAFPIVAPLLLLSACVRPPENEAEGTRGNNAMAGHNVSLDHVAYTSDRDRFYHEASLEIIRCVRSGGAGCRHPYLTPRTKFARSVGSDLPQPSLAYPAGLREAGERWRAYDRFEYGGSNGMPMPVNPREPFTAGIGLVSADGGHRISLTFFYKDGHLESVSEAPVWVRTGKL